MLAKRKSDGKVIEVKPIFRMDNPSDNQRYYEDGDGQRYLPSDLDFDVEEKSDSDLRISVAKLREVLERYVNEYTYTRMCDDDVNNIINEVKSEL